MAILTFAAYIAVATLAAMLGLMAFGWQLWLLVACSKKNQAVAALVLIGVFNLAMLATGQFIPYYSGAFQLVFFPVRVLVG